MSEEITQEITLDIIRKACGEYPARRMVTTRPQGTVTIFTHHQRASFFLNEEETPRAVINLPSTRGGTVSINGDLIAEFYQDPDQPTRIHEIRQGFLHGSPLTGRDPVSYCLERL